MSKETPITATTDSMADTDTTHKTYWKSFRELSRDPEVMAQLGNEFPADYDEPSGGATSITRRTFVGLLAASAALAATGCRRPEQTIVPYVRKPEYLVPGVANHFATAFAQQNFATGLLVRSREGRPIKIEGNDIDPICGGASSHLAQASLLALYDPDRILRPTVNDSDSTPLNAMRRIADAIRETAARGKATRILVDEHASPSLASLYAALEQLLPNTKVVTWPAITATAPAEANRRVLGVDAVIVPDLALADVILGVEADFLGSDPEALYHIRRFAQRRSPAKQAAPMSRFYAVEAATTLTGSNADRRVRIRPGEINEFLLALLHTLATRHGKTADASLTPLLKGAGNERFPQLAEIAADLAARASVVMIGRHLPYETQVLGVLLNRALGAYGEGRVLDARRVLPFSNSKKAGIDALRKELRRGDVGVLLFADVNPAYSMPGGGFRSLVSKVPYRFSLSLYADETSKLCSIFIPINHHLEQWGDARMIDGAEAVAQPLIAPLNEGQPSLADALMGVARAFDSKALAETPTWYDFIRARWKNERFPASGRAGFEGFWHDALKNGRVPAEAPARALGFDASAAAQAVRAASAAPTRDLMLAVLPSHSLYDGRYANLGWLMELPDPVTKVTWDNVAVLSKATAQRLGVKQEDVLRISTAAGSVELPAFIQPGMADDMLYTTTGFGRREGGRVLDGKGVNAFALLPADNVDSIGYVRARVERTGGTMRIATTQDHHSLSGGELYDIDRSDIVKESTLAAYSKDPSVLFAKDLPVYGAESNTDRPISVTQPFDYSKGHRWGMTIDTSACVGCNACVIACVSENNIPMVGKEQVLRGREMHWIRIDRYYAGEDDNPYTLLQPMLCQHCEKAPCENVCPVAATTHSPEGLNEMTYNRCVGTRYCSNNCPYKVRRFNYLNYHKEDRDPLSLVFNPDVTVRMRGVMEKCTFCVQRINEAKHHAKNEGRDTLEDGEVRTACQQACPAGAIVFGNTNDPDSAVSKSRGSDRGYHVLRELNVLPSITYLAKIRNTNGGPA
ncbi:MAG TPA: TAT-variant-translocated molybdopterin oxidoreductase [Bacteroidota bacterium]|nr:TAT-variant-translocated molybdopterin oxidoreductase [Bacteroidota bacterium]